LTRAQTSVYSIPTLAKLIGIDIESGPELVFEGVSGARATAYLHRINLTVRGMSGITLDAGFTDSIAVGTGLLGQQGFFEQLDLSFKLRARVFDITSS